MNETLATDIEVWPVAADETGIWLLSGIGPWRSNLPVPADSSPHGEADLLLATHDARQVPVLHSTSWRAERHRIVLTYLAVLATEGTGAGAVRAEWPNSYPLDPQALLGEVGPPSSWTGSSSPDPRMLDVVLHALRHLAFLIMTDGEVAEKLPPVWAQHLALASPALAGMYDWSA